MINIPLNLILVLKQVHAILLFYKNPTIVLSSYIHFYGNFFLQSLSVRQNLHPSSHFSLSWIHPSYIVSKVDFTFIEHAIENGMVLHWPAGTFLHLRTMDIS